MIEKEPERFDQLIFAVQASLNRQMLRAFKQAGFPLTVEQWSLILRLLAADGAMQHEIAACSGKDNPSVTRLLDNMEKNGWVSRVACPKDRRVKHVYLTDKSKQAAPILCGIARQTVNDALTSIPPTELESCRKTLLTFLQHLQGNFMQPPAPEH